ncbi:hypothetical protein JCM11251_002900 [Rhodosporidiobolus azoricus]
MLTSPPPLRKEKRVLQRPSQLVALLILVLHPTVLSVPPALSHVAALLIRFSATFPCQAIQRVLPYLLSTVHDSTLSKSKGEDLPSDPSIVQILFSLIHLLFSSLPPFLPSISPPPSVMMLQREVDRLTLLLTSGDASPIFSRNVVGMNLEEKMLGVMEGCWSLLETLEGASDDYRRLRCPPDSRLSNESLWDLSPAHPPPPPFFDSANPSSTSFDFDLDSFLSADPAALITSDPLPSIPTYSTPLPSSLTPYSASSSVPVSSAFSSWPFSTDELACTPLAGQALDIPVTGPSVSSHDSFPSLPSHLPSISPHPAINLNSNVSTFLSSTISSTSTLSSLASSSAPTPSFSPSYTSSSSHTPSQDPPLKLTPAAYLAELAAKRTRPATGFASTSRAPIALDAPVRSRVSADGGETKTGKKRVTAKGKALLAKKRARLSPSVSSTGDGSEEGAEREDEEPDEEVEIPQDVVDAMERKRLTNTLSARRCRARKAERVKELEVENEKLRERIRELERVMGLA